jgi:hypothetical protein
MPPQPPPPQPTPTQPLIGISVPVGAPVFLPVGYNLPPGWAVIPAHNVVVVPPPAVNGSPNSDSTPDSVTTPTGRNDVTGDQVRQSADPIPTTNTNSTPPIGNTTANQFIPRNFPLVRSPHPQFPIVVPLYPQAHRAWNQANRPPQPPSTPAQEPPLPNSPPLPNLDEVLDRLESVTAEISNMVRTVTDVMAPLAAQSTHRNSDVPSTSAQTSTSNPVNMPRPRRASHHAQRLSGSEDEFLVDEVPQNIRAPWVDHPIDENCMPLQEVGSPPRRSSSRSPGRLRRRPSSLRHEITEEELQIGGSSSSGGSGTQESARDKGKGKGVTVEDVTES